MKYIKMLVLSFVILLGITNFAKAEVIFNEYHSNTTGTTSYTPNYTVYDHTLQTEIIIYIDSWEFFGYYDTITGGYCYTVITDVYNNVYYIDHYTSPGNGGGGPAFVGNYTEAYGEYEWIDPSEPLSRWLFCATMGY